MPSGFGAQSQRQGREVTTNAKIGIHSLVFGDVWDERAALDTCRKARDLGFDLIEVLIFDPASLDVEATRKAVAETGLGLRLGMALGAHADISSPDPAVSATGAATVRRCLDIAADLGAPAISGITYAAFHRYFAPATRDQRRKVASALHGLDEYAGKLGLKLGIEPVNRYESNMINSLDQAADMIRLAGARHMFIHMDTFHMNVEEADLAGAIARNADLLGYAHIAENNRGEVGAGTFDWVTYFRALAIAGYKGDVTIEGFSSAVLGPDLIGGVGLWRQAWDDSQDAAARSLAFVRSALAAAERSMCSWQYPSIELAL
jgi:D-psicose/D-tagatose/L-ribulose 3-epimerase